MDGWKDMYTPATLKLPHSLVISPPQLLRADNNLCYQTVHYINLITHQCSVERMCHQQKQSMTDRQADKQTTDKVIHMWRFAGATKMTESR